MQIIDSTAVINSKLLLKHSLQILVSETRNYSREESDAEWSSCIGEDSTWSSNGDASSQCRVQDVFDIKLISEEGSHNEGSQATACQCNNCVCNDGAFLIWICGEVASVE